MRDFSNCYNKYVYGLEQINAAAAQEPLQFIREIEKRYNKNLKDIAKNILKQGEQCKIVMVAGPSGSGKTTTSHMLKKEFEKKGVGAIIISLDDFYLGEGKAPLLLDGTHDYEAIEALNVKEIKKCLANLIKKGYCDIPTFDFKRRSPDRLKTHVEVPKGGIVIVEGIHALNPIFTGELPKDGFYKIYISVKQGVKDYNGEIISRSEVRFLRRLVRDEIYRSTDPERTFSMWNSVCRGEVLYIYPFKRSSDATINSIHMYEPCILCQTAIPLLKSIDKESINYDFASKLLSSMERFYPIDPNLIPSKSLIREFIGGGDYIY